MNKKEIKKIRELMGGVCDLDDDDATQSWVCSRNCTDMFEPRWEEGEADD